MSLFPLISKCFNKYSSLICTCLVAVTFSSPAFALSLNPKTPKPKKLQEPINKEEAKREASMSFDDVVRQYRLEEKAQKNLAKNITEKKAKKAADIREEVSVDITADQIRYDQESNFYEEIVDAQAYIPQKDATLYADKITFGGETKMIEATGAVKVVTDDGQTISGTYTSFNMDSKQMLLDNPRLFLRGIKLKARKADSYFLNIDKEGRAKRKKKDEKDTIYFHDGMVAFEQPQLIYFKGRATSVRTRYGFNEDFKKRTRQPTWRDISSKPLFKYTAKEIIYDDTRDINNLEIKGARLWVNDKFSIPVPVSVRTTTGEYRNSRFIGPIFGTRTRIGGFAMGPRFYKSTGHGVYALAPVLQIGNGPGFGAGAIATYNRPNDTTALMFGYGSLDDRFIGSARQLFPYGFEFNYSLNQFVRGESFGLSQVGQFAELAHKVRLRPKFADHAFGIRLYNSVGYAEDNDALFSSRRLRDLRRSRGASRQDDFNDFRTSTNVDMYTAPLYRLGNENINTTLRARITDSLRFYGTGDSNNILRFGPAVEFGLKKLVFEMSYLTAVVSGESPFLFDQFVDGDQAFTIDGDYEINDWISIGGFANYNFDRDRFTRTTLRTDFGPKDFKMRIGYDPIRNQLAFGINMVFGDPVAYDELEVKI